MTISRIFVTERVLVHELWDLLAFDVVLQRQEL